MTYKELIGHVKRIMTVKEDDFKETDVIKLALNDGYNMLCYLDKRVTKAYTPVINGIVTLPNNLIKIVSSVPQLSSEDSIVGNSIITQKKGVIEILYSYTREPMVLDSDEPDLNDRLQYALIHYACFKLSESRGEPNNSYINLFSQVKNEYEEKNDLGSCFTECVIDVCGGTH